MTAHPLRAALGVIGAASAMIGTALGLLFVLAIDTWRDSYPDAAGNARDGSWTDGLPLAAYIAVLLFVALAGAAYIALVVLRRRPAFADRGPVRQGLVAWLAGLAGLAVLAPLVGLALATFG
ncbi:hypothetical protein [Nocardioides speluncae]|uniref:hypothetical protein n=1 Tax=Nocardioides speluncae TaxID=2670337 RepID=UPI000D69C1AE|nr:hypothetical protein [Nocardioides speluncae]